MTRAELKEFYRRLLYEGLLPFWLEHGADRAYGGVLSCMNEEGRVLSTTKYLWSQGRWLWLMARLYNRIEARPEFLELARRTARFLLEHGADAAGRYFYAVTREGEPREGPISVFADCFAVYGLNEYARAAGDPAAREAAVTAYRRILARIADPAFADLAPESVPPGRKAHGVPMILLSVADELAQTTADAQIEADADRFAAEVMTRFLQPERRIILEYLDRDYGLLPPPEGTHVVPGHGIESMWFQMRLAHRRGDAARVRRAAEVMRRHVELGWDRDYGGLVLHLDADGNPPRFANAEKKVWWVHSEALYGLLLAHALTGEDWAWEWYQRVHAWSFAHFPLREFGEWWQRLDRQGKRVTDLIALPVKDPFHLMRAAILTLELLGWPRQT